MPAQDHSLIDVLPSRVFGRFEDHREAPAAGTQPGRPVGDDPSGNVGGGQDATGCEGRDHQEQFLWNSLGWSDSSVDGDGDVTSGSACPLWPAEPATRACSWIQHIRSEPITGEV